MEYQAHDLVEDKFGFKKVPRPPPQKRDQSRDPEDAVGRFLRLPIPMILCETVNTFESCFKLPPALKPEIYFFRPIWIYFLRVVFTDMQNKSLSNKSTREDNIINIYLTVE